MPAFTRPDRPLVIAHRGLSADFPENTLPAFAAAVAAGADMVELDYRTTADGVLVCVHDGTLRRYIGQHPLADTPVEQMSFEQIRRIDLGRWKSPQFADTVVPTLEEAMRTILAGPAVVALIERKSGTTTQTTEVLDRLAASQRSIVQSFDWGFLADFHKIAPHVATAALEGPLPAPEKMAAFSATGARTLHLGERHLTQSNVDAAHAAGLAMWVYTIDSEIAFRGARIMKVDGVTTNRADRAMGLLKG